MNATIPLATLVIDDQAVTFRPRWFAAWFTGPLLVPLPQIVAAFPVKGWLGGTGVGLEYGEGQSAYFWTMGGREQVLSELALRGVRVDPTQRSALSSWRSRSGLAGAGSGAPLRGWLVGWLPVSVIASVPMMVWLLSSPGPLLWRAWVVIVGVVGGVTSFRMWRAARRRP